MDRLIKSFFVAMACLTLFLSAGCGGEEEQASGPETNPEFEKDTAMAFSQGKDQVLKFSAIPGTNNSELNEKLSPLAQYLTDELGVQVQFVPAPNYVGAIALFLHNEIQFAWFGGLTGVQARHKLPGALAIAQGVEDPNYFSYFIAHKDSGIPAWNGEDDQPFPMAMQGKAFTFGSPSSTSGRLMPEHFVTQLADKSPESFFEEVHFSGAHDATVKLVNTGRYQVGAVDYKTYERMKAAGDAADCIIIWKTPLYADYNLTVRGDLDETYGEGSIARLQEVLIAIDDPELLLGFDRSSLIAAGNTDFQAIADLAKELDFLE